MDEAHVEHLVGLVEHQVAGLIEPDGLAFEQVDQPPRGRHQQIGAPAKPGDLGVDRGAADDEPDLEMGVAGIGGEVVADLLGQFARRRQDQPAHRFRLGLGAHLQEVVRHRQAERGGLAGAGLGDAHHVAPRERVRNGLLLDRGRIGDALLDELFDEAGGESEIFECGFDGHMSESIDGRRPGKRVGAAEVNCRHPGWMGDRVMGCGCPDRRAALPLRSSPRRPLRDLGTCGSVAGLRHPPVGDCGLLTRQRPSVDANAGCWPVSQPF